MSFEDEHFLFLKSDDSLDFYPLNRPDNFTVQLSEPIHLDDSIWICALRDFTCHLTYPQNLYIFCDIVQDSHVFGRKLPIMQRVPEMVNDQTYVVESYDSSVCFKITRPVLTHITVYIKNAQLLRPSFADKPTTCMLHLIRKSKAE